MIFVFILIFRVSKKRRLTLKESWPTASLLSMNFSERQLHWLSLISQMHQWLCRLLRVISLETINVTVLWQLTRWDNICDSCRPISRLVVIKDYESAFDAVTFIRITLMIYLSDFQPLSIAKIKNFSSTTSVSQKIFSDKFHAILIEEQPRSQGLSSYRPLSERGETLAHAGHVSPRIWEMTINLFKGRVG